MQTPPARCSINLRQGSVLVASDLDLNGLGITLPADHNLYIVISHDCDIANTKEPTIELISCSILAGDATYTFGQNIRLLHLPIFVNGQDTHLEIEPLNKVAIDKSFFDKIPFNNQYNILPENIKLLQNWLAARYRRHAFPDTLNTRLKEIENHINSFGKKTANSEGVIGIFLMIDPPEIDAELDTEDPYELRFRVIYESEHPKGEQNAEMFVQKIDSSVGKVINKGISISVPEIIKMSDAEFTLKDSRSWVQWRFEHLSFRGEQIGSLIEP